MNSWIAFGLILSLIFAGSVALDYGLYVNNYFKTINQFPVSVSRVDADHNLNFTMSLNTTSILEGQSIGFSIEELNLLNMTNVVNATNNWPLASLKVGPCGTLNYPMGFAIYQGYYTETDIQSATPLSLYESGVYYCPLVLLEINSYAFNPLSDYAGVNGLCTPNPCFSMPISSSFVGNGYWVLGFHVGFQPGVYTIAGGDEWGQLILLHFNVV